MIDDTAVKAAEQTVIGAILLAAKDILPQAMQELTENDFLIAECRNIFGVCQELFAAQKAVDPIVILDRLGGGGEQKVYLTTLAESVPSLQHVDDYIAIVRESARRRRAASAAAQLHLDLSSGTELSSCREAAGMLLQELSDTAGAAAFSAAELYYRLYSRIEQPITCLPTGFSQLDRYLTIGSGDFIIIGGRPSAGKTAFSLQMLAAMARENEAVYFSLETGADTLMERMASFFTGTPFSEILRHQIQDFGPLAEGYDRFAKLKLHIVEASGWTVEQLKAKAIQLQAQVIFIDYLQLLSAEGASRFEKVTNISIGLHTLAQQSKMTVIALSQLSRGGSGEPDMASLRESGQVEQDADAVLLLTNENPKAQTGEREIIIAKNKKGATGCMSLHFEGGLQRFTQILDMSVH